MVRGRVGVGVTMLFSDAPFADGAGDDSAVLDSKTSPEVRGDIQFTSNTARREQTFREHTLLHPSCRINLAAYEI